MKVRVHYNLHTHLWSVLSRERGEDYGRVIATRTSLVLHQCSMKVSEKKRLRAVDTKRSVHAHVAGLWFPDEKYWLESLSNPSDYMIPFGYHPHKQGSFYLRDSHHTPVWSATLCLFGLNGRAWLLH